MNTPLTIGATAVQQQPAAVLAEQLASRPTSTSVSLGIPAVITPMPWQKEDDWRDLAECLNSPYDMFFPEKGQSTKEAKKICSTCMVREECLQWALDNDERFGIWGGTSQQERKRIKRQQSRMQNPDGKTHHKGRVPDPAITERDAEIRAARERNVSVKVLSKKYGLSINTIYRISGPVRRATKAG